MDLSVVIVNYQTFDLTRNTINSILKYEYPFSYEIIVVDNASEDNSLSNLKDYFKGNFPLLSDIHIFIRNSDEFEERFWTQLNNITTAFQYSFVITDNLGGKSYVEQKKT